MSDQLIGEKKKIVLLSASPKTDQDWAVSALLAKRGERFLRDEQTEVLTIPVRSALLHRETEQAYAEMAQADAIILIFPLYFFCLPAMLTRFLQDFATAYPTTAHKASVFAIVNCGFPEPEINREAMRVLACFAQKTGRVFSGGVMVGCGGMIVGAQSAPFMRPVMEQIDGLFSLVKHDLTTSIQDAPQITSTSVKFPRALYFLAGNAGWKSTARKNKLKQTDLFRKPYAN
jgi:hypothetical protein